MKGEDSFSSYDQVLAPHNTMIQSQEAMSPYIAQKNEDCDVVVQVNNAIQNLFDGVSLIMPTDINENYLTQIMSSIVNIIKIKQGKKNHTTVDTKCAEWINSIEKIEQFISFVKDILLDVNNLPMRIFLVQEEKDENGQITKKQPMQTQELSQLLQDTESSKQELLTKLAIKDLKLIIEELGIYDDCTSLEQDYRRKEIRKEIREFNEKKKLSYKSRLHTSIMEHFVTLFIAELKIDTDKDGKKIKPAQRIDSAVTKLIEEMNLLKNVLYNLASTARKAGKKTFFLHYEMENYVVRTSPIEEDCEQFKDLWPSLSHEKIKELITILEINTTSLAEASSAESLTHGTTEFLVSNP